MPHIIVTPTAHHEGVEWAPLLHGIAQSLMDLDPNITPMACKGRVLTPVVSTVGSTDHAVTSGFVGIEIKLLVGRSVELRQQMAQAVFTYVSNRLGEGVSVEISEMPVYIKG